MSYTRENPYVAQQKFHGVIDNGKVHAMIINGLAGDDNCNGRVVNVKGSCDGCCSSCKNKCYARDYRYDNVVEAHADNTYYMQTNPQEFWDEAKEFIKKHPSRKNIRINAAGEIPDKKNVSYMFAFGKEATNQGKSPYVYTKRYSWINDWIDQNGKPKMTVLFSPPFTCDSLDEIHKWKENNNPHNLPMFIFDDGKDPKGIGKLPHCPAVDSNGNKTGIRCGVECNRCPSGKTTAVYNHSAR